MTDLDTMPQTSLIEQSNNYTSLPDPVFNQLQALADFLNRTIEDQSLYQQGIDAVAVLHQQMVTMVEDFGAVIEAVTEARDEALDTLAEMEEARDSAELELQELENAVRYHDHSNDLVSALIESVEEMSGEGAMEYAFEVSADNLIDNLASVTGMSRRECSNAADELLSGWSSDLSDDTIKLIEVFVAKAKAAKTSD